MPVLDFIYITIVLYMSMFCITYVQVVIAHVNIRHGPYVNITYEKLILFYYNFYFLMENEHVIYHMKPISKLNLLYF